MDYSHARNALTGMAVKLELILYQPLYAGKPVTSCPVINR